LTYYNNLHYVGNRGDEIFNSQHHINPGKIVVHDWNKKLRSIWKSINAEYKVALSRFTVSGTHNSNFLAFVMAPAWKWQTWKPLLTPPPPGKARVKWQGRSESAQHLFSFI
jgi:hypothetical protein